jgi:hypothetical protein
MFLLLLFIYDTKQDHFAQISLNNDRLFYMNLKRSNTFQYQDRDIFYHGIGRSIKYAQQADIIILGHSMVLFGFDRQLLQDFANHYHIKIYNLALAGVTSGEFVLRIIKKFHLHPSIFILNADDH